jgi:hypothetical protein
MPKKTGPKRLDEPTLTKADWAEAALQFIAEAGLRAVTVNALAVRLGVTKGSFYWHFKSHSELLACALDRWQSKVTTEAITGLSAIPNPHQRLKLMLDAASQPPRSRSLYAALAEAAENPIVKRALKRVAADRIDYLERCYREMGLGEPLARARAVLAYSAYRGLLQLAREAPSSLSADWPTYAALIRVALMPSVHPGRTSDPENYADEKIRS